MKVAMQSCFEYVHREETREFKELADKEVVIGRSRKNPISEAETLVPERTIFLKQKHQHIPFVWKLFNSCHSRWHNMYCFHKRVNNRVKTKYSPKFCCGRYIIRRPQGG